MSLKTADPNDVILLSVGVMVGTTILRHVHEKPKDIGKGYANPIAYGFFLAIALMVLAVPLPRFTTGLAYLGLVGAFAVNGPVVFKMFGGK
jgi:hypothetical protein